MRLTKPILTWTVTVVDQTMRGQTVSAEFEYGTWEELEAVWNPQTLPWWRVILIDVRPARTGSSAVMCMPDPADPTKPARFE